MHKIGLMEDLLVARNLIVFKVYHDHFEYYVCTDQESMGAGGGSRPLTPEHWNIFLNSQSKIS